MIEYDGPTIRKLINNHLYLYDEFKKRLSPEDKFGNAACVFLFNEVIKVQEAYLKEYQTLLPDNQEQQIVTNNPAYRTIEIAIKIHGWENTIKALTDYASNKSINQRDLGLDKPAEKWNKIRDKLISIPKRVQL